MQATASGTFQVTMTPRAAGDSPAALGRFLLAKTFEGALEGSSAGEMLSAGDPSSGSAGYVALEWVEGRLGDRAGRFALQHAGTLDRGASMLSVTVVPGSGSGQLAGLSGRLEIAIAEGVHQYTLHYQLPD
ncbi:MAG TPA: DUF3224 domain-containing protein [Burkholderiaceae bacterium]